MLNLVQPPARTHAERCSVLPLRPRADEMGFNCGVIPRLRIGGGCRTWDGKDRAQVSRCSVLRLIEDKGSWRQQCVVTTATWGWAFSHSLIPGWRWAIIGNRLVRRFSSATCSVHSYESGPQITMVPVSYALLHDLQRLNLDFRNGRSTELVDHPLIFRMLSFDGLWLLTMIYVRVSNPSVFIRIVLCFSSYSARTRSTTSREAFDFIKPSRYGVITSFLCYSKAVNNNQDIGECFIQVKTKKEIEFDLQKRGQ